MNPCEKHADIKKGIVEAMKAVHYNEVDDDESNNVYNEEEISEEKGRNPLQVFKDTFVEETIFKVIVEAKTKENNI